MDIQQIIFNLAQAAPGFLLAIIMHEYAHGWVAKKFGDDTAEREGRLSFNPAVHVDPIGTVVLPLVLVVIFQSAAFGWAKPVPISTRNFKGNFKKAVFWVAFAGPLSNYILGIFSALFYALIFLYVPQDSGFYKSGLQILQYSVFINFILATFNIIPWPPLDGSRMLAVFLKGEALRRYEDLARYTNMIFLGLIVLSISGIHTIGYLLSPFIEFGRVLPILFIRLLS